MYRIMGTAVGLLIIAFLLPVLLLEPGAIRHGGEETDPVPMLPAVPTAVPAAEAAAQRDGEYVIRVVSEGGTVTEMSMADYLWSVVAAEMPASFEPAAIQAQAVTARTYTHWKMEAGEANHPQADVCTDITCCQAFISPGQAAANWGAGGAAYAQKIRDAVTETDGQVITYGGQPIQAVFFSSAGGKTEDAVAVWGNAVPYLVGVDSPEGEDVPNYRTQVCVDSEEFRTTVLSYWPGMDLSGTPERWFGECTRTQSGGVAKLDVGGISVSGIRIRSLFDLRSANFTVEPGEDCVTFHVVGYGHGVGMSQYGANALARQGKTCEEILKWYYTGVEIETVPQE